MKNAKLSDDAIGLINQQNHSIGSEKSVFV